MPNNIINTGWTPSPKKETPATKGQLLALRDLELSFGNKANKDIASAIDNVIDLITRRMAELDAEIDDELESKGNELDGSQTGISQPVIF